MQAFMRKKGEKKRQDFLAGTKELLPLSPRKNGNISYGMLEDGLKPVFENCRLHNSNNHLGSALGNKVLIFYGNN